MQKLEVFGANKLKGQIKIFNAISSEEILNEVSSGTVHSFHLGVDWISRNDP